MVWIIQNAHISTTLDSLQGLVSLTYFPHTPQVDWIFNFLELIDQFFWDQSLYCHSTNSVSQSSSMNTGVQEPQQTRYTDQLEPTAPKTESQQSK